MSCKDKEKEGTLGGKANENSFWMGQRSGGLGALRLNSDQC